MKARAGCAVRPRLDTLEGRINQPLYEQMRDRLVYQAGHAIVWREAIVQYFLKLSGILMRKAAPATIPAV